MSIQTIKNKTEQKIRLNDIKNLEKIEQEKKEYEKKNKDFVMFFRETMPEIRWLMVNYPFASAILFFITEHMDGKNNLICSYNLMTEYFQKDRSTIHRAIKILKENGFLTIMKVGNSNVYRINSDIAWTSYNNQKEKANIEYATLDGKILVSHKENMDYELKYQSEKFKTLKNKIKKQ